MSNPEVQMTFQTLAWRDGALELLDQRALPTRVTTVTCAGVMDVFEAIRNLTVRGAPAIGVAAAYGMVLSISDAAASLERVRAQLDEDARRLKAARPTAVNLMWAVDRMMRAAAASDAYDAAGLRDHLEREAIAIHREDQAMCRKIGEIGLPLFIDGMNILTHCNAGALATSGIGTALAPIYCAHARGVRLHVFADETRPVWQGARLTMWELMQQGVPCTLITDNTAASLFAKQRIDAVIVGADRIAANGDVVNKIGTYNLAVLAVHHGVPFYVAAPTSTFDPALPNGRHIPIEERSSTEVSNVGPVRLAPPGAKIYSPAFDLTPSDLVTAIISDQGITPGGRDG
ncbi:MAG TPA: S-methyl-5-thioribose-1-phosphate isomerase [bacterium]|nr:S-methyl-5-thioribose-1-phosphate isomerase [bacterium]